MSPDYRCKVIYGFAQKLDPLEQYVFRMMQFYPCDCRFVERALNFMSMLPFSLYFQLEGFWNNLWKLSNSSFKLSGSQSDILHHWLAYLEVTKDLAQNGPIMPHLAVMYTILYTFNWGMLWCLSVKHKHIICRGCVDHFQSDHLQLMHTVGDYTLTGMSSNIILWTGYFSNLIV